MTLLRGFVVLLLVTSLQAALGRLWPSAHAYVDLTFLPVIWYGIRSGQRSGMVVGCAAGLLQDAWFQAGVFGLNGFKKTLLGWALGGVGARFDLNGAAGRLIVGVVLVLVDVPLDLAMRRLLDLHSPMPGALEIAAKALSTGLLAVWSFGLVERVRQSRTLGRWVAE